MRWHRQRVKRCQRPTQSGKRSKHFAALNVSHAPATQCLKNKDVVGGGVVDHLGKMNFCALSFGALPEGRVRSGAGLVVIVRVNFGISQNIILCSQALRSSAFLRRTSDYTASGPSRSEKLRHLLRYVNQTVEVRNLAIIGEGPKNAFRLCVVKYRAEWPAIYDCRLFLLQAPPAAAFWKCAPSNNARLSARRHSVRHPQALSGAIGGSNVLTSVYRHRAIDS